LKIAERITAQASMVGRTLAKEVLDELIALFAAAARSYCPTELGGTGDRKVSEAKFERYARLAIECATKLAPYQSPTFRAIVVSAAADQKPSGPVIEYNKRGPDPERRTAHAAADAAAQIAAADGAGEEKAGARRGRAAGRGAVIIARRRRAARRCHGHAC